MRVRVTPKELSARMQRLAQHGPEALRRGLTVGAHRGKAILVRRTPRNTGATANQWEVQTGPREVAIYNGAPHVGVLEAGARPHPVSREGIENLTRWAQLVLGLGPKEAGKVANAIAWKLRKYGQEPTYFVRDSMKEINRGLRAEIEREIARLTRGRA